MPKLIKNGEVSEDTWTLMNDATGPEVLQAAPGRNFIVPLAFWNAYRDELDNYSGDVAVWLNSHESIVDIAEDLDRIPLVALNFPAFADGRSYSNARELRQRYQYQGEVRAIGDVLRDQLYYMSRCGFDAFSLRADQDPESCLTAFDDFKTGYQATIIEPLPLFRRR